MRLFALAALVVASILTSAAVAQAGPLKRLRERIADRRASTCSAAPASAQPATGVHAAVPITITAPGSCPGGQCPAPGITSRPGLFRR